MNDPLHPMHRAFLDAIRETPLDDVHRLIYADWLEEQDNKEDMDRATFIRDQIWLANSHASGRKTRTENGRRRSVYLRTLDKVHYFPTWFPGMEKITLCGHDPLYMTGRIPFWFHGDGVHARSLGRDVDVTTLVSVTVQRGFVGKVRCRKKFWMEKRKDWVKDHPLARVRLSDLEPWSDTAPNGEHVGELDYLASEWVAMARLENRRWIQGPTSGHFARLGIDREYGREGGRKGRLD